MYRNANNSEMETGRAAVFSKAETAGSFYVATTTLSI